MTQTRPTKPPAARDRSLKITEIFLSIQGEGTRAGRPCTFVRLTGCDLRCVWCDTAYAFAGGKRMDVADVLAEVRERDCPLVCITGGEPLLQPVVHPLMCGLVDAGHEVLLETGGHRDISRVDPRVVRIVDLKAPGSGETNENRWENVPLLRPHDEVKIVIADRVDYEWARARIDEHALSKRVTVLLSPVHGVLDPRDLAAWILEDRLDVRLQIQIHKVIWGPDVQGV